MLTKCRTCGKEVSVSASICPHCGERRPGQSRATLNFYLAATVVVFALLGYRLLSSSTSEGNADENQALLRAEFDKAIQAAMDDPLPPHIVKDVAQVDAKFDDSIQTSVRAAIGELGEPDLRGLKSALLKKIGLHELRESESHLFICLGNASTGGAPDEDLDGPGELIELHCSQEFSKWIAWCKGIADSPSVCYQEGRRVEKLAIEIAHRTAGSPVVQGDRDQK